MKCERNIWTGAAAEGYPLLQQANTILCEEVKLKKNATVEQHKGRASNTWAYFGGSASHWKSAWHCKVHYRVDFRYSNTFLLRPFCIDRLSSQIIKKPLGKLRYWAKFCYYSGMNLENCISSGSTINLQ